MKFAASVTLLWLLVAVGAGPVKRVLREARPQFPFGGMQNAAPPPNGIGVQTPIGGFHLGLSTGLTVNLGRRPADPTVAPEVPEVPPELLSEGVPSIGDGPGIRSEETPASVAPPASEAPVTETSENHPCYGYDPNQPVAANATTDDSSTANPCGFEGNNRISPKQAALLSLVG